MVTNAAESREGGVQVAITVSTPTDYYLLTSRGRNRNEGKDRASTCGSTPEDSKDRNHGMRLA